WCHREQLGRSPAEIDSNRVVHVATLVFELTCCGPAAHCETGLLSAAGLSPPSVTDHPPSIVSTCPVTKRDASLRKYTAAPSRSSGCPIRPPSSGCFEWMNRMIRSSAAARCDIGVSTRPAALTLMRMPSEAYRAATARLNPSIPALAVAYACVEKWRDEGDEARTEPTLRM